MLDGGAEVAARRARERARGHQLVVLRADGVIRRVRLQASTASKCMPDEPDCKPMAILERTTPQTA